MGFAINGDNIFKVGSSGGEQKKTNLFGNKTSAKDIQVFGGKSGVQRTSSALNTNHSTNTTSTTQTSETTGGFFSGLSKLRGGNKTAKVQAVANVQAPETTTVNGILKTNAPVLAQNTTLEGDAKTGAEISQILDKMSSDSNVKLPVTSNEWRELAGKKNKTPEDIKKLDAEYNTNIKKLGNSLTKHISETYANGGDIDMKAFSRFQDAGMNLEGVSDEDKATIKKQNEILFNKIDQDHDGKIDDKEISAYMHVLDFNEKGQMNGIIDAKDVYRTAFLAQNPEEGMMDKMLKYSYNKLYGNE